MFWEPDWLFLLGALGTGHSRLLRLSPTRVACATVLLVTSPALARQVTGDNTGLRLFMKLTVMVTNTGLGV